LGPSGLWSVSIFATPHPTRDICCYAGKRTANQLLTGDSAKGLQSPCRKYVGQRTPRISTGLPHSSAHPHPTSHDGCANGTLDFLSQTASPPSSILSVIPPNKPIYSCYYSFSSPRASAVTPPQGVVVANRLEAIGGGALNRPDGSLATPLLHRSRAASRDGHSCEAGTALHYIALRKSVGGCGSPNRGSQRIARAQSEPPARSRCQIWPGQPDAGRVR
jgi:hypothetical protein